MWRASAPTRWSPASTSRAGTSRAERRAERAGLDSAAGGREMPKASYSVTINRPVADVFAYVADGERCKEWRPGVLDIKRAGGEMTGGVGTRYLQGVKGPMGRRISADYEITVVETDKRIQFQTVTG